MKRVRIAAGKHVVISAELAAKAARVFATGITREQALDLMATEPRHAVGLMAGSRKPLTLSKPRGISAVVPRAAPTCFEVATSYESRNATGGRAMKLLAPLGFPEAPSTATLRSWSVLEVVDDDGGLVRLAVGWINATKLRITSPLVQFEGGQVVTRSGSIYTLEGPPASAEELQMQEARRDALLGGRSAVDVTARYSVSR